MGRLRGAVAGGEGPIGLSKLNMHEPGGEAELQVRSTC
jgi:hypothetical protein